jgi:TPR repeat protein
VAEGQHNLALLYYNGTGVRRDYNEALRLFQLAANQNLPASQHAVGRMYQNGQGVGKNRVEAIAWYLKASDQGYELAKQDLRAMGITP